jgi:hypothetical protein
MKVRDLLELLSKKNPEDKVMFRVEKPHTTIGGSPAVAVVGVTNGFDWDDGKVFLNTPLGTHLFVGDQRFYRDNIEYKQLVGGIRGKNDLEEAKKNFLSRKEFEDIIIETCEKLPNCMETIHQTDRYHLNGADALAAIFEKFKYFEGEDE